MKPQAALLLAVLQVVAMAALAGAPPLARDCPQPRFTGKAPDEYYRRTNPLSVGAQDSVAGRSLFQGGGGTRSCATCHGEKGDGRGEASNKFNPRPRNFTCMQTIDGVPDGQLFWIIRFGSPGTKMPPNPRFSDEQVWQLVAYLRQLAL